MEGSHTGQVWYKYEGHALLKKVKLKTPQIQCARDRASLIYAEYNQLDAA